MADIRKLIQSPAFGRLVKLEDSLDGADRTFMVLQYASGLIASLAAKGAVPLSLKAIKRLQVIKAKCSEWRTIGRFLGLLAMARWGATLNRNTHWSEWLRWASVTLYYPCEHLAYLSDIGVLSISPLKRSRLVLYSVRFWGIYLVLEIYRLARLLKVDQQLKASLGLKGKGGQSKSDEKQRVSTLSAKEEAVAENSFNLQLAYFPMALHWGIPNGVLPSIWPDVLPLMAAFYGWKKAWVLSG